MTWRAGVPKQRIIWTCDFQRSFPAPSDPLRGLFEFQIVLVVLKFDKLSFICPCEFLKKFSKLLDAFVGELWTAASKLLDNI